MLLLAVLSIGTAASTCTVPIKNQRWYGDKGAEGAVWFETLTDARGHVSKTEWDEIRFGMACSATRNFADTKAALEKLCHQTKNCVYIEHPATQKFFLNIESIGDE